MTYMEEYEGHDVLLQVHISNNQLIIMAGMFEISHIVTTRFSSTTCRTPPICLSFNVSLKKRKKKESFSEAG